jgi:outer membrane protein OmpA-like peptidoglycan-associated protein
MWKRLIFVTASLVASQANANICGTDYQNFNPTTSGLDFVTVQSSETLKPCYINGGFFINYAANSLTYSQNLNSLVIAGQKRNDRVLGADLSIGTGITDRWDVGFNIPFVLNQEVKDNYFVASFEDKGATEIKANTKYRFVGDENGGVAGIISLNQNLIEDNPFMGKNPGITWNFELAADTVLSKKWAVGVNGGFRKRDPGDAIPASPFAPMRDQWIYSVAASYLIASIDTKIITEIYGSQVAKEISQDTDRSMNSLEGLLGFKHDASENMALHFGATTQLDTSLGGPDWRVYAGLNWTIGPTCKTENKLVAEAAPTTPAGEQLPESYKLESAVLFKTNSDDLTPESEKAITDLVAIITASEFDKLVIEGHTDSVGDENYNQELSTRRAKTVQLQLIMKHKLEPSKVEAVGFGATQPIGDNGNYQGRMKNRRVEFKLWRKKP